MCRWFAYISKTEPCLLEDVLILPDHAISKQVDDHFIPNLRVDPSETEEMIMDKNFNNNTDGLGIAWYSSTRNEFTAPKDWKPFPTLYKTLSNPPTDPNFISICSTMATKTLFAHIRAASPGMP